MHKEKTSIEDLAIFGGPRLFDDIRMTGQLFVPDKSAFFRRMDAMYQNGITTDSRPIATALELRLKEIHATRECIAVTNACFAIMLLLKGWACAGKSQVLLPAFSYRGLPHLIRWAGMEPRFCDVTPHEHTLCPDAVQQNISANTAAILAVHNVNALCDIERLEQISSASGVPLIIDSVYALGSRYGGEPTGGRGAAEIFSLHATKLLNGFEGGYITTNDVELAARLRRQRDAGLGCDGQMLTAGLNASLNDVHAALALESTPYLTTILDNNARRYRAYREQFGDMPGIAFAPYHDTSNCSLVLMEITASWPLSRQAMVKILRAENALVRTYYDPPLPVAEQRLGFAVRGDYPVAHRLAQKYIQMPVGEGMSVRDIQRLAALFKFILAHADSIAERIGEVTV